MSIYKDWIWRQWLGTHIPKNLWYANHHNGCAIIVRAWEMEAAYRHSIPRKGIPRRLNLSGFQTRMVFSNLPAYRSFSHERLSGGIVGSIEDFKTFCLVFPVQLNALEIPPTEELTYSGRALGDLDKPEALLTVLNYATELCERDLPKILNYLP